MKRPESKKDVMELLGALNYYSEYFRNMHVILAPLYTLLDNDVLFQWNKEREAVFLQIKQTLTQKCELTLTITQNTIFNLVDASAIGVGTVIVQDDDKGQMKFISYNSSFFTEPEQKIPVIYRKLSVIGYALEIYYFTIIGSKHPITTFTDRKQVLSLNARKSNINPHFSGPKLLSHDFQNLLFFGDRDKYFA